MKANLLRTISISIIFILSISNLKASHIQSGYISYQYLSPNTYLVKVTLKRDCAGIGAPSFVTICYSSTTLGVSDTINILPIPGTGNSVPITSCSFIPPGGCAAGVGVEEWVYADTLILVQAAPDWVLGYKAPTGTFNPWNPLVDTYLSATINSNYAVNSTPLFNDTIYSIYCCNIYSTMNYNCTDPDGDSVSYILTGILNTSDSCPYTVTPYVYTAPYSPTNPISSSTPPTLNPSTGLLEFIPNIIQVAIVSVKINEYRNGVLISSFTRFDNILVTQMNNSIDDIRNAIQATVTPSIFSSQINVTLENPGQVHFQLSDITGRTLMVEEINRSATIATSHLTSGVYFYRIYDNENNFTTGKLVKE